jgi:hypothetical protein
MKVEITGVGFWAVGGLQKIFSSENAGITKNEEQTIKKK